MTKKKISSIDSLNFMAPPVGLNVSRLLSQEWLTNTGSSKTIEDVLSLVTNMCIRKGLAFKLETVDISTLSYESNQVLYFYMDLTQTPTSSAFNSFVLRK
jgi:hypothetical protein